MSQASATTLTSCWAASAPISLISGGAAVGSIPPSASRARIDARSNRNPSTPCSAQCRRLRRTSARIARSAPCVVLPHPESSRYDPSSATR